jgi:hypothetical protein
MILDQLITGYLDGDLTAEQDQVLRELVRTDPAAREAFEASVLIHIAMRWEDDTDVPEDLRTSVLGSVDALAMTMPVRATSVPRRRPVLRTISSIAVLLLAMWLPVSDAFRADTDPLAIAMALPTIDLATTATTPPFVHPATTSSPIPVLDVEHANDATAHSMKSGLQGANDSFTGRDEPAPPLSSLLAYGDVTDGALMLADGELPRSQVSHTVGYEREATLVTVSTSYGAGISSSVGGASDVRQIAASIGYGLSDVDVLGMEIGTTSYTMQGRSSMLVTPGSSASMAADPSGDRAVPGKLASPEPISGSYSSRTFDVSRQESVVWGSAFYERRFVTLSSVSFTGRAGAGVGEDGLLGYGRVMGQWSVGAGLSIVVGAEARAMPFRMGAGSGSSTYGTVLTALTGLYMSF